jgi:hypothetical protein
MTSAARTEPGDPTATPTAMTRLRLALAGFGLFLAALALVAAGPSPGPRAAAAIVDGTTLARGDPRDQHLLRQRDAGLFVRREAPRGPDRAPPPEGPLAAGRAPIAAVSLHVTLPAATPAPAPRSMRARMAQPRAPPAAAPV